KAGHGCKDAEVIAPRHRTKVDGRISRRPGKGLKGTPVATRSFNDKSRALNTMKPTPGSAKLRLPGVGCVERQEFRTITANVLDGAKRENGSKAVAALGHQKYERAPGAVAAEIYPMRIDVVLFGQIVRAGKNVVHLAEETFLDSWVLVSAAQRGKHHD